MAITLDIQLPHYPRGFHLVTRDIISHLPELPESGLLVVLSSILRQELQSMKMQIRMYGTISRRSSTNLFRTAHLTLCIHWKARTI